MMVYEVIAEPPLKGADQTIVTPVFDITEDAGATGVLGFAADLREVSCEKVL